MLPALRVEPDARERVWGGRRLGPPGRQPIGELWVAGGGSRVAGGPLAGRSLDELAAERGADLVGTRGLALHGARFPLLVKLLDPADWLSVQVHPDDDLARRLEGPGAVGKTEAWFVLDADPSATLLVGVRPDVPGEAVRLSIARADETAALLARVAVTPGDAILIEAGTLHAVGPGVFLYEVQEPSDITYRVADWGRPETPERHLHRAQSLASVKPANRVTVNHAEAAPGGRVVLVACEHFELALLRPDGAGVEQRADGSSVHVVTAFDGPIEVAGGEPPGDWREALEALQTIVVPANAGTYAVRAAGPARALVARVP